MSVKRMARERGGDQARGSGQRSMHLSLRSGERLFLNGAVLRVDRKVTLELLNDATFLLENHVLQLEDTHTPLRQLYFAAQAILMDPQNAQASRALFDTMASELRAVVSSKELREGVAEAQKQVAAERTFHALKTLRAMFADEAELLGYDQIGAGTRVPLAPTFGGERPRPSTTLPALQ